MATVNRKIGYVQRELLDVRKSVEEHDKFERCAFSELCCSEACDSARCWDSIQKDGSYREIDPRTCETCARFKEKWLSFPMMTENILLEQPPEHPRKPFGANIGDIVAVRPCNPAYGDKTYLGVLVGEMPTQIGLHSVSYDSNELAVLQDWFNPLIVVPELNVAVWGYESWWRVLKPGEGLEEITDEAILSQPYMAALMEFCRED